VPSFSNVQTADQIETIRPDWIWPVPRPNVPGADPEGRIARGILHVLAGKPDQGKGMCAVRIGADLANAGFNVLHSAIEDSPGLITKPRYQAAGVDGDALKRVFLNRFRLPANFREFKEFCVEQKDADGKVTRGQIDAVIIDPLASHLSDGISRHSDNIRVVTDPLIEFIEQQGIAVIIVEHVNKNISRNADPLGAIGGSGSGLPAATRMGFIFGTDPDSDDKILTHIKGNICEKRPAMRFEVDVTEIPINVLDTETGEVTQELEGFPALLFNEECIFDPIWLLTKPSNEKMGRPNDRRAHACEWLTTYLYNATVNGLQAITGHEAVPGDKMTLDKEGNELDFPGVPSGRVFEDAKQQGLTEKTLRRAKAEMAVVVDPPGGGRNCRWFLPDEILELLTQGDDGPSPEEAPAVLGTEPALDPSSDKFNASLSAWLAEESDDEPPGANTRPCRSRDSSPGSPTRRTVRSGFRSAGTPTRARMSRSAW
jgi:hypothetical protein